MVRRKGFRDKKSSTVVMSTTSHYDLDECIKSSEEYVAKLKSLNIKVFKTEIISSPGDDVFTVGIFYQSKKPISFDDGGRNIVRSPISWGE